MKKILSLLLTLVVIFALAACGDAETEGAATPSTETSVPEITVATEALQTTPPTEDEMEKFPSFIGEYVDLSHYGAMEFNDSFCSCYIKSAYRTQEDAKPPVDGYITVDGNVKIALTETKVSELLDQGWQFVGGEETAEKLLKGNLFITGLETNLKKDGKKLQIALGNPTADEIRFGDAYIHGVILKCWDSHKNHQVMADAAVKFDIDGKINQNSNLSDIIAAFGEPVSILYSKTSDNIEVSWDLISITLNSDGTKIEEIHYQ